MSTKVHCYLRTLRTEWKLTQEELSSLLPQGDADRVSCVERALKRPNAAEILAYSLIFGPPPQRIFPKFVEDLHEDIMVRAYLFDQQLISDGSAEAQNKRVLLQGLRERAINGLDDQGL